MATEVLMPKLGLTMTEGTIEEWKFKEGDTVKKGDILFSVATDKLTNDVEAEEDGTLLKILLPEGETAPCKSVIAWIGAAGEAVPDAAGAAAPAAPAAAAPAAAAPAAAPAPAAASVAAGQKTVIVVGGGPCCCVKNGMVPQWRGKTPVCSPGGYKCGKPPYTSRFA